MRLYELTYLVSPEISEEELKNLQEKINSFIQNEGGILNKTSFPLKKKLSYPIKKKHEAFLTSVSFYSKPEKIENLEKKLKAEGFLLRYLISTEKLQKKAAVSIPKKLTKAKPKKVELKDFEKKLEEILGEETR